MRARDLSNLFYHPSDAALRLLLASTALVALLPGAARAQTVIDSGAEVVSGLGTGTQASPWIVGDQLIVGDAATGILNIVEGGVVSSDSAFLGNTASGVGNVGVTGAGSSWTSSDRIWVGYEGVGGMTISDGAAVNNLIGNVGFGAAATGGVTITDAGSVWDMTQGLYVGIDGVGYVTASNGGALVSASGSLGDSAGAYGEITVNGATSSWDVGSGGLRIGEDGTGVLNIQDGASVSSSGLTFRVGINADGDGSINMINGASLDITAASFAQFGATGTGRISVNDSSVNAGTVYFGMYDGSLGTGTLTGPAATWTGPGLVLGQGGVGQFAVENGASLALNGATLGVNGGASGTLTVDNATTSLNTSAVLGWFGNGAVTVQNGGTLTSGTGLGSDYVILGYGAGGLGSLNVTGVGSSWTADNVVQVGLSGTGVLGVSDGANVTINDELIVGDLVDGSGSATVDNAALTADNILLGDAGTGAMVLANGATVLADDVVVGNTDTATGSLAVDGAGSQLNVGVELSVGHGGTGSVAVTNGGGILVSNALYVGNFATGIGSVAIDGTNSEITNLIDATIGQTGIGTMAITGGGAFYNDGETYLGVDAGSAGTLTLDGVGTLWENGGYVVIGDAGTGAVSLTGGAQADNHAGIQLGSVAGSQGALAIDGAGSSWTDGGAFYIGEHGEGTVSVADGGRLVGTDAYVGYEADGIGAVRIAGAGSEWENTGASVTIGEDGTGALTLADGGLLTVGGGAGTVTLGRTASSSGTLNIGAALGDAATGAGLLDAGAVTFGAGNGALVFNHADSAYNFAAPITGTGSITQKAGVTNLTGDASGFAGSTYVLGGALQVNTTLGGTVAVAGGTLGGSGSLGGVAVGSGGTLAPGNSIGTLNLASASFIAGSTLQVELNDGGFVPGTNSDLVSVTGAVTIAGGTIAVLPENGTDTGETYTPGTYTIMTAAGGVTGTFDTVRDSFVFLDFTDSYDANNVYLTSEQAVLFSDIAQTRNQTATAAALEELGGGNTVFDALVGVTGTANTARAAIDALSGEVHASAQTVLLDDARLPRETALGRLRAGFGTGDLSAANGVSAWAQGIGAMSNWASDGNAAALSRAMGGFIVGADMALGDAARFGLFGGASQTGFDIGNRTSSGTIQSWHVGAYGGVTLGDFALRAGAGYSASEVSTTRSVSLPGYADTLTASYAAQTLQVFGEASYRFALGGLQLEPFANLAYVNLSTDAYGESGGAAALSGAANSMDSLLSTLGVRAETEVAFGEQSAVLSGMVGWQHAFGTVVPSATHSFAGSSDFTVFGLPVARETLVVNLGAAIALSPSSELDLSYGGQFGSGFADHSLAANFTMRF